jgi:solute carrier family 41
MNVFKRIPEIYILVPSLLGLKGNLEMTLASRLSTQVCFKILIDIIKIFSIKGKYWKYE